jgi:NAD(P)H-hydrate epimerase
MSAFLAGSVPILTCDETRMVETRLLGGDERREWAAMERAGNAIAAAVRRDFSEIGVLPADARVLVLAGKGHNAGDALIAARALCEVTPKLRVEAVFVFGERPLRPLAQRAWRELAQAGGIRVDAPAGNYDLCLDGIFGFQFRPPLEPRIAGLIATVNALTIRFRAAVDLPSANAFRADFTYATGCVKTPIVGAPLAGRVRYLDLGFFDGSEPGAERVLTRDVLAPLAALRPAQGDKRTYGHVFMVAGSRDFPGAALMGVRSALRGGAGLVTAFVPESLGAAFAAVAPEAMWVGWPETPSGGLALEGRHLLTEKLSRASALVIGPGLGRDKETLALATEIVGSATVPLVIDADALQPDIVRVGSAPRVLTPHAGEFARIEGAVPKNAVLVRKGPVTRIVRDGVSYHSFFGGPVLARGGSGDVLAGLTGGLLAQTPRDPLLAAARGVVWHGLAADALARAHGQTAVQTTQLLDFLPVVLRELTNEQ